MKNEKCITSLFQKLKWYISLIGRFTRLKPKCSLLIIFFTLASQVLMLASFLLPLKMLFVLALGKFEPISLQIYVIQSKEELALLFCGVIIGVILLYFTVEKVVALRKEKCSKDIWQSTRKLQVYSNHETLAETIYSQYIRGLTGFSLFGFVIIVLSVLYPLLAIVLLGSLAVLAVVMIIAFDSIQQFRLFVEKGLPRVLNAGSMFVFAVAFIFIMNDVISDTPSTSVFFSLISLILIRHMMGSLVSAIQSINNLYNQQYQLATIFFKEHPKHIHINLKEKKFWELFENGRHNEWIPSLIESITLQKYECIEIEWFEMEVPNEFAFIIDTVCDGDSKVFFFKIYNKNLHAKALKEIALLTGCDMGELVPEFLGSATLEEYDCHLFGLDGYERISAKEFDSKRVDYMQKLVSLELDISLVEQYRATHKLIHERFTEEVFNRVVIAANDEEKQILQLFEEHFDRVCEVIDEMPLQLVIQGITVRNTILNNEGEFMLMSFGGWNIEPLGFGLSQNPKEQEVFQTVCSSDLITEVKIVSELKACEHNCNIHRFKYAIGNMKVILELLKENV